MFNIGDKVITITNRAGTITYVDVRLSGDAGYYVELDNHEDFTNGGRPNWSLWFAEKNLSLNKEYYRDLKLKELL
jgi:hypothetical protein